MTQRISCIDIIQVHFGGEVVTKNWSVTETLYGRVQVTGVAARIGDV